METVYRSMDMIRINEDGNFFAIGIENFTDAMNDFKYK